MNAVWVITMKIISFIQNNSTPRKQNHLNAILLTEYETNVVPFETAKLSLISW